LAAFVMDVDLGFHRQAHAQRMVLQFLRVERHAHRQALHHLDPVARGVLCRQQRERRARTRRETGHLAVVRHAAAIHVGHQFNRLAHAHVAYLDFLEVGVHPELVQRHDGHQRRTRSDALADLHRTLGYVARDRCRQAGTRIGKVSLADFGGSLQHIRVTLQRGLFGQHAVALQLFLRSFQCRLGSLHSGLCVRDFFLRHRARTGNLLAAG